MLVNHHACAQSIASRNSSADRGDFGVSPEMVQTLPVWPWVPHAPGAKMTVVYTNSLKSLLCNLFERFSEVSLAEDDSFQCDFGAIVQLFLLKINSVYFKLFSNLASSASLGGYVLTMRGCNAAPE